MDKYAEWKYGQRDMLNRFSHWFKAIKDIPGPIKVPKSFTMDVPVEVSSACCMDNPATDERTVREFVETKVIPALTENGMGKNGIFPLLFLKNAVFSNKFNASGACLTMPTVEGLTEAIIAVNMGAMECIMGYDSTNELVIRERIMYLSSETPTIYNGLPFRPEFRVFYDFDAREVIFVANYWDADYCKPHLYAKTDKIVWDVYAHTIQQIFDARKREVAALVTEALKNVQGLSGPWSVDIMLDTPVMEGGTFYLIDMAVAEQSAYWERRPGYEPPPAPPKPPKRQVEDLVVKEIEGEETPCIR